MTVKTQIVCDVDLAATGKQRGYLRVPYSHNEGGWSQLQIPIIVTGGGPGPTVLAIGGNHGDEFEGPVALLKLGRALDPHVLRGRVIVVPMLNLPGVRAGTRLSPLDGENMNRAFPGSPNGSVTSMVAHYVSHVLMPMADIVMDIHSGGRSMVFWPCATLHQVPDSDQYTRMLSAALAFGSRYVLRYADVAGEGLLPVEAERQGKLVVTTEMGGGGDCNPSVLRIAERGIRNVLVQQGMLEGAIAPPAGPQQVVAADDPADYVTSPADGLFECYYELGSSVTEGQPLGAVHVLGRVDVDPVPVMAESTGILIGRRAMGNARQGDNVATIAQPIDD